jgi:two-component system, NtrC family, response regulator
MGTTQRADILIVDDDKGVVANLNSFISRLDYKPFFAYNLKDAGSLISEHPFDIIFLDVELPDGNGLDFLDKINTMSLSFQVIVMTTFTDPDSSDHSCC